MMVKTQWSKGTIVYTSTVSSAHINTSQLPAEDKTHHRGLPEKVTVLGNGTLTAHSLRWPVW